MNWTTATPAGIRPKAAYEAARRDKPHRSWRDGRDGDATVALAGERLRRFMRHLDQNHDIVHSAFNKLVQFIVGPSGIGIDFLPRRLDGTVHREFASALQSVWTDWIEIPDVTWEYDWIRMQHIGCRTWLRDGEFLAQIVAGTSPLIQHGTLIPLSLEMIEADQLPLDLNDEARGITQGVERNAWGRPRAYHLYLKHPGSATAFNMTMKRVPAEYMLHVKLSDRFRQARGVPAGASAIQRLNDIHEYENSERIAARMAADLAGQIKKGSPDTYSQELDVTGKPTPRQIYFQPGMVIDDLRPGESIEMFDHKRPNPNLVTFRDGQLRAASGGFGVSNSSMSRDYNSGTYSGKRQELVEQHPEYQVISWSFIQQFIKPVQRWATDMAVTANLITIPPDLDMRTLYSAAYSTPPMPWINPVDEIDAIEKELTLRLKSPQQVIRERRGNPADVLDQWREWEMMLKERKLQEQDQNNQPAAPAVERLRRM